MTSDASDLFLPHVRQFTIGLVLTDPPHPKVLGTGILVSTENLNGILTCCHVADKYEKRSEIGVVRFSRDGIPQRQKVELATTETLKIGGPPWADPYAFDLAFTLLAEPEVAALKATSAFLNYERNRKKFTDGEPKHDKHVDAVFGLVDEFTGEPWRENGSVTTPMQGVLTPGHIVARNNGALTLECMEANRPNLPKSFGGNSGGGLWRLYLNVATDGSYDSVETRLCGVATYQLDEMHIICQGVERIEQVLMDEIRKRWLNRP
jgi:hypothetical protein